MKAKKKSKPKSTGLSLHTISHELGISRDTLRRKLLGAEIREPFEGLRWRDVFRAFIGDKAASLARKALADAEMAEHEVRLATRDVIPREEVARYIRETFSPVREWALAMPAKMAKRCNPTDPRHAQAHLDEWAEEFLKHCREHVPEGQKEEEVAAKKGKK
jgi:hypothetical protein